MAADKAVQQKWDVHLRGRFLCSRSALFSSIGEQWLRHGNCRVAFFTVSLRISGTEYNNAMCHCIPLFSLRAPTHGYFVRSHNRAAFEVYKGPPLDLCRSPFSYRVIQRFLFCWIPYDWPLIKNANHAASANAQVEVMPLCSSNMKQ